MTAVNGKRRFTIGGWILLVFMISTLAFVKPLFYGIEEAQPVGKYLNTTFPSKLPANWEWQEAYPTVSIGNVITTTYIPGTTQMALGTVNGKIHIVDFSEDAPQAYLMGDLAPDFNFRSTRHGLKGIAFHPEYGTVGSPNSKYVFISYVTNGTTRRLSRFTVSGSPATLDLDSELIMMDLILPGGSYHSIGEIAFDHEGYLYVPLGDGHGGGFGPYAGTPIADTIMNVVQRIDHNLSGGLLRIDVDQDPARSHPPRKVLPQAFPDEVSGIGYWIPNDNPWVNANGQVMEEYFSLGHRNPWKLSMDQHTGTFWVGEVGPHNGEEINKIAKGYNYGWPYKVGPTGDINWDRDAPTAPEPDPYLGILQDPHFSPSQADASSIMGGNVYRGSKYPELYGKVVIADVSSRKSWVVDAENKNDIESLPILPSRSYHIVVSHDGDVLLFQTNGGIKKLVKGTPAAGDVPLLLSQTGAFSDLASLTPSAGMIPYSVNSPLWSDRAVKDRWIALPNDGAFDSPEEKVAFSPDQPWEFPEGTVIIKHFELPINENNPNITKRIETRFIVVGESGRVYGVTYKWREDESEADLLLDGDSRTFSVIQKDGSSTSQVWNFPSRDECLTCHNQNAGQVLGLKTHQLNGDITYPSTEVTDNQLKAWNHLGIFDQDIAEAQIPYYPKSVSIQDPHAGLEIKVRSYLDANCSQCHQPGGVTGNFDARLATPLQFQNLINGSTISPSSLNEHIVKPGNKEESELWVRDNSNEANAMPPLGRNLIDDEYINVLTQWINQIEDDETAVDGLDADLLAHWSFDQGSLQDVAGSINDAGIVKGNVQLNAEGKFGQSIRVAEANSFLEIPHSEELDLGVTHQDFTVSFWLKVESHQGPWLRILNKQANNTRTPGLWINHNTGGVYYRISTTTSWDQGGSGTSDFRTAPLLNSWQHIAYVKKGNTLSLFVNGVQDQSPATIGSTVLQNQDPLIIGNNTDENSGTISIDEVKIYKRGLTEEEVLSQIQGIGETAIARADHNWKRINFQRPYTNPVVVAGAPSFYGGHQTTVRINNVTSTGFDVRVDEWECQDERHFVEDIPYVVVEAGVYELPNGSMLMAGSSQGVTHAWVNQAYPTDFNTNPLVLASVSSENETSAVVNRIDHRSSGKGSFRIRLQEEKGADGIHAGEIVNWIAIEPGMYRNGNSFEAATTGRKIGSSWGAVSFSMDMGPKPIFISSLGSWYGGDPAGLRFDHNTLANFGAQVFVEEDACTDGIYHTTEDISFWVFKHAGIIQGEKVDIASSCAEGFIVQENWLNLNNTNDLASIPVNNLPDQTINLESFEVETNYANTYGIRVRGYICPPQTGLYTFKLASDDKGILYVSSDDSPQNKATIASVPGWTRPRQYNKYASQVSAKIQLTAGQRYYVEALMKEKGGGDNLSVAWELPDGTFEAAIGGEYLSPFTGFEGANAFSALKVEVSPEEVEFSLYPNPVSTHFYLKEKSNTYSEASIRVSTLEGKLVLQEANRPLGKMINVSSLSRGIYLVEVQAGSHRQVFKIMKN